MTGNKLSRTEILAKRAILEARITKYTKVVDQLKQEMEDLKNLCTHPIAFLSAKGTYFCPDCDFEEDSSILRRL